MVRGFAGRPHAALDADPGRWVASQDGACGACHGGAAAHAEDGDPATVATFDAERVSGVARSEVCMECHGDDHPLFPASHHAAAGLACNDCHTIHGGVGGALLPAVDLGPAAPAFGTAVAGLDEVSATCAECHGAVLAQFQFNERHRLQEGVLSCKDCHDPHAPPERRLLGGFDQGCVSCHGDKDGPFVFEHGAQRVEGCVACHAPHGSPNRHMLTFQSTGELCYSCHGAIPGFHARFTLESVCTNCHSTIHGSNLDADFLK